jgi:hypothetical protein
VLVACPQCEARYDFPAETLPEEGLRAKCVACGHVLHVTRQGVRDDALVTRRQGLDEETPALSGYALVTRRSNRPAAAPAVSLPPPRVAPMPVADDDAPLDPLEDLGTAPADDDGTPPPPAMPPVVLPPLAPRDARRGTLPPSALEAVASSNDAEVTTRGGRTDRTVPEQPKVILDLHSIGTPLPNEGLPTPAPVAPPADETDPPPVVAPPPSTAEVKALFTPDPFDVPDARAFHPVRRALPWALLCIAVGIAVYFAVRPQDRPPPAPGATAPKTRVEAPLQATGDLEIDEVRVEWLPRKGGAVVHGVLHNRTGLTQSAVALTATLARGDLPVRQRVVACCEPLTLPEATTVAATPEHPHLAPRLVLSDRPPIGPGERRPFSVVFAGATDESPPLSARVEVKFSEPQRSP